MNEYWQKWVGLYFELFLTNFLTNSSGHPGGRREKEAETQKGGVALLGHL
jgi:hypothetical protein